MPLSQDHQKLKDNISYYNIMSFIQTVQKSQCVKKFSNNHHQKVFQEID